MIGAMTAVADTGLKMYGMAQQSEAMGRARMDMNEGLAYIGDVRDLRLPDEDYQQLDYLGDYNPEAYGTQEAAQYQTVTEDPATRAIQMQALQRLVAQADGSADAHNAAGRFEALDSASRMANSREGAIRQEMERKGQGGTGTSALMRAQAAQMGANRAQGGTLDAYSQAALQKLAAQQGAVGAAGQVRGQDFSVANTNANTINDFNRFNVAARNRAKMQDVDNRNSARLRNLGVRQEIGGRNTGINNSNIDRSTNDRTAMYNARMDKAKAMGNIKLGAANLNQQQAPMYGQMGKDAGQMFTNFGSGMVAGANASKSNDEDEGEWM